MYELAWTSIHSAPRSLSHTLALLVPLFLSLSSYIPITHRSALHSASLILTLARAVFLSLSLHTYTPSFRRPSSTF